ncbi:hypothetical protein [Acinetobacter stercoris]|uniref:Uncharacterized protein n=1 Tax=Acinetobacter stercoris TaxID=2126983 RepID=A0A2U3N0U8_9GAMM|nr:MULTISPECIES: hypothetical protein [Acinetobacter]SPL71245.1 hypothetical protein KPC_2423 [Acinetobacter stercoris]
MEVVAYLHNSDLLLEDEKGVAVICGSHYVLSIGDKVHIREVIDQSAKLYQVQISFASAEHAMMHDDEIQMKFVGDRSQLDDYLLTTTVH